MKNRPQPYAKMSLFTASRMPLNVCPPAPEGKCCDVGVRLCSGIPHQSVRKIGEERDAQWMEWDFRLIANVVRISQCETNSTTNVIGYEYHCSLVSQRASSVREP